MNTINFSVIGLGQATISFVQMYNQGIAKGESIETRNQSAFGCISIHEVAAQLTKVMASSTFYDNKGNENGQSKQTFKISCQRYFRNAHSGKALTIKGNTCKVYTLASDETTDFKGKVVKIISAQQIEDKKTELKRLALEKEEKALQAEQAIIQLEVSNDALKSAENTAAIAVKQANSIKKSAIAEVEKAKTSAELLAAKVAELTLALEKANHETSATIAEYQALKKSILDATSLKALKATLTPGFAAMSQPSRNLNQQVAQS